MFPSAVIRHIILTGFVLIICQGAGAQTNLNGPVTGSLPAGEYYNTSSIVFNPGFSADGTNGNYHFYIQTDCAPLQTSFSPGQNYILVTTPRVPLYNPATTGYTACDINQTIQYFDGLGRPIQTIQVNGSPTGRDIVQPMAYDQYGREALKYLPYTATAATSGGAYQASALSNQVAFYNSPTGTTWNAPGVVQIMTNSGNVTYSKTGFEPSPLNRVVEQGYPGGAWQISGDGDANSSGNTTRIVYTANDQTSTFSATNVTNNTGSKIVAEYGTVINAATSTQRLVRLATSYDPGQLYVTITRDENWQPGGNDCIHSTEEYKDKEGHIVLKRTYNQVGSAMQMLSTYYVYDDLGNLAFVIPPQAGGDNTGVPAQNILDNLCYQYRYDARSRQTSKKVPGNGWEYMVYNTIDQVIGTQDSVQRMKSPQEVSFIKYDAQGRVIITGIFQLSGTPIPGDSYLTSLQSAANAQTTLWETRITTGTTGYTNLTLPTTLATTLVTNYYDDYNYIPGIPANYTPPPGGATTMTRGLLTVSKIAVLNTPADILWTVNYYDDLGRNIQTYKQHYLGDHAGYNTNNYDVVSTGYDFTNQPNTVSRKHYTSTSTSTPAVTINNTYVYDHAGRKTRTYENINGGTNILLSQTDYNEIGQVLDKQLHSTDNGTTFLQTETYGYNSRGWLLKSTAPLFQEQLQYNVNSLGLGSGFTAQYNGNIASQTWTNGSGGTSRNYIYLYDNLNRLLSGVCNQTKNSENNISYDLNGNITGLNRYMGGTNPVDQLTYTYTDASSVYHNQLQTINDATTNDQGLKHGIFTYAYDPNGNLTTDNSKGLAIGYNILNLPQTMTLTGSGTVTYTYDANGDKLRKLSTVGTAGSTDYISGIEYDNGVLAFIQTEEGRAIPGSSSFNYEYNLNDHLGNVRLTFDSHTAGTATPVQQDDYMPFGMDLPIATTSPANNYLYNKKELQQETKLYDYGARFYDPVIGRWTTVDPLAEKYQALSPYNYVADDPIKFVDADGRVITIPDKSAQAQTVANINKLSRNQYAVNAKTGALYMTKAINKNGSSYYSTRLNAAIGKTNIIEIQKKAVMEDKMYPNNKLLSTDVDKVAGGGITDPNYNSKVVKDKDGNETFQRNVRVVVSGNAFTGFKDDKGNIDPESVIKDTNGNNYNDDAAHVLMHELVGHAIPITVGTDTGNAVEDENKVNKELPAGQNAQREADPEHIEKKP